MGNFGAWEIALVVLVILLVFGPKRLPGIGRSLGRGMREFKDSVGETAKELKEATADTPAALKDGFNPKKSLKDALNPFAEDKPDEEEVVEGEIVQPEASAHAAPVATAVGARAGGVRTGLRHERVEPGPSRPYAQPERSVTRPVSSASCGSLPSASATAARIASTSA
jgi:sec-independent protein translocase protein TatA